MKPDRNDPSEKDQCNQTTAIMTIKSSDQGLAECPPHPFQRNPLLKPRLAETIRIWQNHWQISSAPTMARHTHSSMSCELLEGS
eukprot:3937181-Rhodomonas_salina.3